MEITEKKLKNSLAWFFTMNNREANPKNLRKTEKILQLLWDYIEGKVILINQDE